MNRFDADQSFEVLQSSFSDFLITVVENRNEEQVTFRILQSTKVVLINVVNDLLHPIDCYFSGLRVGESIRIESDLKSEDVSHRVKVSQLLGVGDQVLIDGLVLGGGKTVLVDNIVK